jgi:hypothetical protein
MHRVAKNGTENEPNQHRCLSSHGKSPAVPRGFRFLLAHDHQSSPGKRRAQAPLLRADSWAACDLGTSIKMTIFTGSYPTKISQPRGGYELLDGTKAPSPSAKVANRAEVGA